MEFHHTQFRDRSQVFSEDRFGVLLSEVITGCVKNHQKYLKSIEKKFKHIEFSDSVAMVKCSNGTIDYISDIGFACHVLYSLLPSASEYQEQLIYVRLEELDISICPRPGEIVKKPLTD